VLEFVINFISTTAGVNRRWRNARSWSWSP